MHDNFQLIVLATYNSDDDCKTILEYLPHSDKMVTKFVTLHDS